MPRPRSRRRRIHERRPAGREDEEGVMTRTPVGERIAYAKRALEAGRRPLVAHVRHLNDKNPLIAYNAAARYF